MEDERKDVQHRSDDTERKQKEGPGDPGDPGTVESLNEAIRQELKYLDVVVATPFRAVRRTTGQRSSGWAKSLDEMLWAAEGMARVPIKMLQSAFGEPMKRNQP
ncbi:hypothetical protein [Sulfobacillus sp. hq2]|uniref:Uncharacterized protein n=1 Tax=Sulfobacillus thermotolerans TaxID=338644 RepID=A0ABM6RU25_9FIRM|nr:hypothetical protein [Sulfobacillus sp. hq2]AUW94998.1 hypothetical protein BXT84_14405 [Sulfobacillus thermotolerans]MCY0908464.1 hypothetical protein [Sulfobacillus thermotolerans]